MSTPIRSVPPDVSPAPGTPGDDHLVQGLLDGDEVAFAAIYRRWGALVHTMAWRALGDTHEAEDITQLVFVGAWRGRAGYRPDRGSLGAWLVGIARRKIADALTARTSRTRLMEIAARDAGGLRHGPAEAEAIVDRVLVLDALSRLPVHQQTVLSMIFYEGLTQAEISVRTGMPLGTVKSHCRRGMNRLRSVIE
ncbi:MULTISPECIES: sigma-70 family RNA polymerase sigma factor [Streptomyces]|uniref:RNA polymerase sigma factor n=1 Tax=Streptomyces parvus TaxID=66428 RepID=A0A5D4JK35_9ACTN|nr:MULTISPECIES: sigma-70 family RNA polymerase sigma factor [Streptomyces]TYR65294.1 sigma-70 family RNA polymerase sigma factor [Streptomyces parvus]